MVFAIHLEVPWAAVPVVVADEVDLAGALDIEGDVAVFAQLIQEVRGIGPFVAARAIVGAAHVGADADALIRPAIPHAVRVQADGHYGRPGGGGGGEEEEGLAGSPANPRIAPDPRGVPRSRLCIGLRSEPRA